MIKNIAILIPSLMLGGAEKQAALLAMVLNKHYNVYMYILYGDKIVAPQNLEILSKTNVHIQPLSGNFISKVRQLKKKLEQNRTELLLNYLTSCNVIGAIAGHLAGVKRVYGGMRNAREEYPKMIMDKVIHNYISSGSIYNCYSGAKYFTSKGYNQKKNIVIPNCFWNIATPIIREDREIKHIVTVGRFVPQKDYKTLIRTIACLLKLRKDFVMDIIGYGIEEKNIRNWVKENDLENIINIYLNPDNVQKFISTADIYFSTSIFEGTSNSIMEALNWSLPVVATNVGDNEYLIKNGVNGFLHHVGDTVGMAQSLAKLLNSVELRNQYGLNGNQNLRDNYSIEIFENRYLQFIDNDELV